MDGFQEDYIREAQTLLKVLKEISEDEYEEILVADYSLGRR